MNLRALLGDCECFVVAVAREPFDMWGYTDLEHRWSRRIAVEFNRIGSDGFNVINIDLNPGRSAKDFQ